MYFKNIDPDKEYKHTEIWDYVNERDGGLCQDPSCGRASCNAQHHILNKSQGGKTTPNNLITLCKKHHDKGGHGVDRHDREMLFAIVARNEKKFRSNLVGG